MKLTNKQKVIKGFSEKGEKFKDIKGFKGKYMISNFGKVLSLPRNIKRKKGIYRHKAQILVNCNVSNQYPTKTYYKSVQLFKNDGNGYRFLVHRLVALHFVKGKSKINIIINHKDGKRDNNNYRNLEWTTYQKNFRHALDVLKITPSMKGRTGLRHQCSKQVNQIDINGEIIRIFESMTEASKFIGVDATNIGVACVKGGKSGGYYWSINNELKSI